MMKSSGERLPKAKRVTRLLWIAAIASASVYALTYLWYQSKADLGEFWGWNPTVEIVFQLILTLSAIIARGTLLTLLILKLVKMSQARPIIEFNKANKYTQIRKLSLWIAGIPGLVLLPMFLALLMSPASNTTDSLIRTISNFIGLIALGTLLPGIGTMFALLVIAFVKAGQKPIDPMSPIPIAQLTQITLAAITAAMPTIAFLTIWLNAFEECETNCFIFNDPIMIPLAVAYLALWLAQAIIWLGNRNKLVT